jgi:hypothetical protein
MGKQSKENNLTKTLTNVKRLISSVSYPSFSPKSFHMRFLSPRFQTHIIIKLTSCLAEMNTCECNCGPSVISRAKDTLSMFSADYLLMYLFIVVLGIKPRSCTFLPLATLPASTDSLLSNGVVCY